MKRGIRHKIVKTADAIVLSAVACTCIYGILLVSTAKSILKMQTTRVDL